MLTLTAQLGLHNLEGAAQFEELGLALVLSAAIGLEREIRQKSAGLRTHSLVGLGAALFMLVSKYGFEDVVVPKVVVVDPSRVAAQIVTGIGFLGAGLIFVRQDSVRGLTTAASVWLTAAVGSAAGAGLPLLAVAAAAAYFVVVLIFSPISRNLPASRWAVSGLRVRYRDGQGVLREVMREVTDGGFSVASLATKASGSDSQPARHVEVSLEVFGRGSVNDLAERLSRLEGVESVQTADSNSGVE